MSKILVVTDTTSTLGPEEAKKLNLDCLLLSVMIDGKEYRDHVDISNEAFADVLRQGKVPTTSQPNLGYLEDKMQEWKAGNYDDILVITLSATLSGTYQAIKLAAENAGLNNVTLYDTRSVGSPLLDMALEARKMADEGAEMEKIIQMLDRKKASVLSFLFPKSLDQLKKGGRISPLAANMASLLKIKPILYLDESMDMIEKYKTARTESKVFDLMLDAYQEKGINCDTHRMYVLISEEAEAVHEMALKRISSAFSDAMEVTTLKLPAVLCCHAGLGTIALQCIEK